MPKSRSPLGPLPEPSARRNRIRDHFLRINRARLERARATLNTQQQVFLDLLPLLFHINHPALPGYCSPGTPCGIDRYHPSPREEQLARPYLGSDFRYQPRQHRAQIRSIFLIGSCGTIAQTSFSDIDIWLCHDPRLNTEQRRLLTRKMSLVRRWAQSLGLDVYFFLMDNEEFRRGERRAMSAEDCGSSQHYLLLDEFYRTGLLVAGRVPLWWLVPPEEEINYDRYIREHRQRLATNHTIDFGSVPHIPAGEFIGAGIWQLYKAITSPYKSALKLMLTELYAQEYPRVQPLSLQFKRTVYDNRLDIDDLDPYVIIYRRLEWHLLARGEHERLELIRRCLYLKSGLRLADPGIRAHPPDWRHRLMSRLVKQWGWSSQSLRDLDNRHQWKIGRVTEEYRLLTREQEHSYLFIRDFARRTRVTSLIDTQEMDVLGRKLNAAAAQQEHKIEWLNLAIAPNLAEPQLTFCHRPTTPAWTVHAASPDHLEDGTALKAADSVLELLCWCHCNQVLAAGTAIHVAGEHAPFDAPELHAIVTTLGDHLPSQSLACDPASHHHFTRPPHLARLLLFANLGVRSAPGGTSLSGSPLHDLEVVAVNSWGEVFVHRCRDEDALRELLDRRLRGDAGEIRPIYHCAAHREPERTRQYLQAITESALAGQGAPD